MNRIVFILAIVIVALLVATIVLGYLLYKAIDLRDFWSREHTRAVKNYDDIYAKMVSYREDANGLRQDLEKARNLKSDHIARLNQTIGDLKNRVHNLELENDDLRQPEVLGDRSVRNAIDRLYKVHRKGFKNDAVYVVEESTELQVELLEYTKSICKAERNPGKCENRDHLIEEACDVLTTILVMLKGMNVNSQDINEKIIFKTQRAIDRFNENGRL